MGVSSDWTSHLSPPLPPLSPLPPPLSEDMPLPLPRPPAPACALKIPDLPLGAPPRPLNHGTMQKFSRFVSNLVIIFLNIGAFLSMSGRIMKRILDPLM